jgi:cytochrome c biogenesis protein CcmG/thiol:disulfide interchange protein DsbE
MVTGAVAVVAAVSVVPGSGSARPGALGAAPLFRLDDLRHPGSQIALADHRGRPVVVNFWASWCVPCRREMPALQEAYRKLGGRVVFLGVDHEDARSDALKFLAETHVGYPSAYDPSGKTAAAYGLLGLPTTVFISPAGRIVERHIGELTLDALEGAIAKDFPGVTGTTPLPRAPD